MLGREHRPAILLPVLVCLSLGVVCAYASSVVCVLTPDGGQFAPRTSTRHDLSDDRTVYIFTVRRVGYRLMAVTGPMPSPVADELDKIRSQEIPIVAGDPRPYWLRWAEKNDPQTTRGVAAGWPFLCVWGRTDNNVNHKPQARHTGLSYVVVNKAQRTTRAFPWLPLIPGLAANVLFYAITLLVLWSMFVWMHRGARRRRGRCPNCAYPMQDRVEKCPECGMPRQPAVTGSNNDSASSSTSSRHTTSTLTSKSSISEAK